MTRAAKTTFIAAAAVGLVLGGVLGGREAAQASQAMQSAEVLSASSVTSDFARQQFEYADTDHARRAVQLQISVLEKLEGLTHDRLYRGELGYAYTRLGMIEQSAGQPEAEQRAIAQARTWFGQNFGHEISDDQMRTGLKLLDQGADRL